LQGALRLLELAGGHSEESAGGLEEVEVFLVASFQEFLSQHTCAWDGAPSQSLHCLAYGVFNAANVYFAACRGERHQAIGSPPVAVALQTCGAHINEQVGAYAPTVGEMQVAEDNDASANAFKVVAQGGFIQCGLKRVLEVFGVGVANKNALARVGCQGEGEGQLGHFAQALRAQFFLCPLQQLRFPM